MGFLDSVKTWLGREAADARDMGRNLTEDLGSDLDRREADLAASPMEKMEKLQSEIAESSSFDAVRDKIEGTEAHAIAESEVAEIADQTISSDGADSEIVDAEIVDETSDEV